MSLPEPSSLDLEPEVQELAERLDIRLIDGAGRSTRLPLNQRGDPFSATVRWRALAPPAGFAQARTVDVSLISHQDQAGGLGVQLAIALDGPVRRFMVPGIFYDMPDRPAGGSRCPRYQEQGKGGDALTANHWSFRADRATHPMVIGWSQTECVAIATEARSPLGLSGLGFEGAAHGGRVLLNFPAREEPVTFIGQDAPAPAEVLLHQWQSGEIATVSFEVFFGPPDEDAYDALLRGSYARAQQRYSLRPWLEPEEAAAIVAEGLYRWHYRPETGLLLEATAFQPGAETADVAPDSHPTSSAAAACALLAYGHRQDIWEYVEAAVSTLDTIARTLAGDLPEQTLFLARALALDDSHSGDHPDWRAAIASTLTEIVRWHQDGRFGGLLWIPALIEGMPCLPEGDSVAAAVLAGEHYAHLVDNYGHQAGAGDGAPRSSDACQAVMAYTALFEATENPRWLQLARRAANWMMSFRFAYNIDFPANTMLQTYDFRSRGADLASPREQQLQPDGLICVPEMMRLARYTGDDYYLDRTRDNLACFLQFIARVDGDFNAGQGMLPGGYFHARGARARGSLLPISRARSAGLLLSACQAGLVVEK